MKGACRLRVGLGIVWCRKTPAWRGAMSDVLTSFLKHKADIKRYLSRFFSRPHDVEDAAQEAFLKAFATEIRTEVRSPKKLLFTAAKHVALNEVQRKASKATDFLEDFDGTPVLVDSDQVGAEEALDGKRKLLAFSQAVASLPPACRQVFLLRKFDGLSHKEIARRLKISVSGVEKHIATGTVKCSRYLRRIGYDPLEFGGKADKQDKPAAKTNVSKAKAHDR